MFNQKPIQEKTKIEHAKLLNLKDTCDPEFIFFKNSHITQRERFQQLVLSNIIMILIVIFTNVIIYIFKQYRSSLYFNFMDELEELGYR